MGIFFNLFQMEVTLFNQSKLEVRSLQILSELFWYKIDRDHKYMLKRPINMSLEENNLREYFDQNRHSAIEGIYEKLNDENSKHLSNYKLGVVASESDYDIIYLSGALNYLDWSEGERKAKY